MTNLRAGVPLPRPAAAPDEGPLDTTFYDLVETRVRRLFADNPIFATYFGIHTEDHRLGDASRDAAEHEIAEERAHLAKIEALDPARAVGGRPVRAGPRAPQRPPAACSSPPRSAAGSAARRRRATSATRCSCCSRAAPRRSPSGSSGSPTGSRPRRRFLEESRTRAVRPQVGIWQGVERRLAKDLPGLFDEVRAAADGRPHPGRRWPGWTAPRRAPPTALEAHDAWIATTLEAPATDWPLGREAYDELVRAPGVRRPGRGRDPRHRLGPAPPEPRRAPRGGPRDRPGRRRPHRHRARQGRPPGRPSTRRSGATPTSCAARGPTSSSTGSRRSPTTSRSTSSPPRTTCAA